MTGVAFVPLELDEGLPARVSSASSLVGGFGDGVLLGLRNADLRGIFTGVGKGFD